MVWGAIASLVTRAGSAVISKAVVPVVKKAVVPAFKQAVDIGKKYAVPAVTTATTYLADKIPAVAKKLAPKTLKGWAVAGVATPVIAGAIAREPKAAAQVITRTPSDLMEFGGDTAEFLKNPSLKTAGHIVKDSPVIATSAAFLTAFFAGKTVAPLVGGWLTRDAIKDQTKQLEKGFSSLPPEQRENTYNNEKPLGDEQTQEKENKKKTKEKDTPLGDGETPEYNKKDEQFSDLPKETIKPLPTSPELPPVQETTTITTGRRKRPRRKPIKPDTAQKISQRVNILINNRNTQQRQREVQRVPIAVYN